MEKPKLLLSACCAPCATVALEQLSAEYNVTMFFWGNNIHPQQEYQKRLESVLILDPKSIIIPYDPMQPEVCEQCFEIRFRATAAYAKNNGFECFAATLTTSPHKPAELINHMGARIAEEYGIKYLPTNFKKNNGFQRSVILSKQLGLYRQKYCGCQRSETK